MSSETMFQSFVHDVKPDPPSNECTLFTPGPPTTEMETEVPDSGHSTHGTEHTAEGQRQPDSHQISVEFTLQEWIPSVLHTLYTKKLFCNTRLHCSDGRLFDAHDCVLAAVSPVWKMRLEELQDPLLGLEAVNNKCHMTLPIDSHIVEALLSLIYTGSFTSSRDTAVALMEQLRCLEFANVEEISNYLNMTLMKNAVKEEMIDDDGDTDNYDSGMEKTETVQEESRSKELPLELDEIIEATEQPAIKQEKTTAVRKKRKTIPRARMAPSSLRIRRKRKKVVAEKGKEKSDSDNDHNDDTWQMSASATEDSDSEPTPKKKKVPTATLR